MNIYLVVLTAFLAGLCLLDVTVNWLNLRRLTPGLPAEFSGFYDPEKYAASRRYLKSNACFEIVEQLLLTVLALAFILLGGFEYVDRLARSLYLNSVLTGLVFIGVLIVLTLAARLPFAAYATFVIEEKYGFNRTTVRTFVLDIMKSMLVTGILAGAVFAGVQYLFEHTGTWAWFYCWAALVLFQLSVSYIAPVVLLPLFNRYSPLEDGELKRAIEAYAHTQDFKLKGIYTMNGSLRSTKGNAMFTGYGRFRRIVLFDTLIARHGVEELVAILAHETGHYKRGHIIKQMLLSFLASGVILWLVSLLIHRPHLFEAFQVSNPSVYAGIVLAVLCCLPVEMVFSFFGNWLSRRYELGADDYALATTARPEALLTALKRLCVDNYSNLTPHPLKVFFDYSHPPVLERLRRIAAAVQGSARAVKNGIGLNAAV